VLIWAVVPLIVLVYLLSPAGRALGGGANREPA
jgi:hypothetical protein